MSSALRGDRPADLPIAVAARTERLDELAVEEDEPRLSRVDRDDRDRRLAAGERGLGLLERDQLGLFEPRAGDDVISGDRHFVQRLPDVDRLARANDIGGPAIEPDHCGLALGRPDDRENPVGQLRMPLLENFGPGADEQALGDEGLDVEATSKIPERMASGFEDLDDAAVLGEEAALVFGNNIFLAEHRRSSSLDPAGPIAGKGPARLVALLIQVKAGSRI